MNVLTPDELTAAGELLFGERWQTDLALALGLTDPARIRQMLTGRRPVPAGFRGELVLLLRERGDAALALAEGLATDVREPVVPTQQAAR